MYSKTQIFNLACSALLLSKEIINPDTDETLEARTLRKFYPIAFNKTVSDLNLDGLTTTFTLEKHLDYPSDLWQIAYKYPTTCAMIRRIRSQVIKDTRLTMIEFATGIIGAQKCVFTNETDAVIEFISTDVNLSHFSAPAGMALATHLASLCSPLIVGKGATSLRESLRKDYILFKAEAQELDREENPSIDYDNEQGEWVAARTS